MKRKHAKQYAVVLISSERAATGTEWVVAEFGGVLWNSEARYRKWVGPNTKHAIEMAVRFNSFKDSHLNSREKSQQKRYHGYDLD